MWNTIYKMDNDKKSQEKWWKYRKINREEAGKMAIFGLIGFAILNFFGVGSGLLGDIFGLIFWIAGLIWIVKTIQLKIREKKAVMARTDIEPNKTK